MKQHITKEQWDELTNKRKDTFWNRYTGTKGIKKDHTIDCLDLTIGQMIEFLEDDLDSIENMCDSYIVYYDYNREFTQFETKELCDALWEAVKYKLSGKHKKITKTQLRQMLEKL